MKRTLCLVLLIEVFTMAGEARAQTLADAARSERARQRASASRTYTNADIAASSTPVPAAPATAGAAATARSTGPVDKQGRDEKYWRDAFERARADLKRAEARVFLLESQRSDLSLQILRQSNLYNRENVLSAQLNTVELELATMRQTLDAARLKISELEDELRRSGGQPGWAR